MVDFVPAGYLTISQAIDRVVELMQGGNVSPLLTEDERTTLRTWRDYLKRISRHVPEPVTPVPKVGDRGLFVSRAVTDRTPRRHVEAKPSRPNVTAEEIKDLTRKETLFEDQRPAAGETLRQSLYVGRLSSPTITDEGSLIETPKDVWGGDQWYEVLRSGRIKFGRGLGVSVSGQPLIPRDALEAAFNPEEAAQETLKEKAERWEERQRQLMSGDDPEAKSPRDAAKIIAQAEGVDWSYVERETRRVKAERP